RRTPLARNPRAARIAPSLKARESYRNTIRCVPGPTGTARNSRSAGWIGAAIPSIVAVQPGKKVSESTTQPGASREAASSTRSGSPSSTMRTSSPGRTSTSGVAGPGSPSASGSTMIRSATPAPAWGPARAAAAKLRGSLLPVACSDRGAHDARPRQCGGVLVDRDPLVLVDPAHRRVVVESEGSFGGGGHHDVAHGAEVEQRMARDLPGRLREGPVRRGVDDLQVAHVAFGR